MVPVEKGETAPSPSWKLRRTRRTRSGPGSTRRMGPPLIAPILGPVRNAEGEDYYLIKLSGDVRFDHVDFAYEEGKTILHDISLFAKPGQKLAFVGATGAARPPSRTSSTGSTTLPTARSATTASPSTTSASRICGGPWASCSRTPTSSPAPSGRISATATWTPPTREVEAAAALANAATTSSAVCPGVRHHAHRQRCPACPRASGSCWPSPGRPWPIRR